MRSPAASWRRCIRTPSSTYHCGYLLLVVVLLAPVPTVRSVVSPNQLENLGREALIELDGEVSEFYSETYDELDKRNTNFTDQLYKAIRSIRHTSVVHHTDFRYTSNATKWRSMGNEVDKLKCTNQLWALASILNATTKGHTQSNGSLKLSLSLYDFFSSSGQVGSGVLNGNLFWAGSEASCEHVRVPGWLLRGQVRDLVGRREDGELARDFGDELRGRYCVAHLRAKSWPHWDRFFEDRITIKRGLCMPRACHSALFDAEPEIRAHTGELALAHLSEPFGDAQLFELQTLYCLPDEDSEHRQLDLGSKLLIAFVLFWSSLTIYANYVYHQRAKTIRKLRQTVDIRMIINERRDEMDKEDCYEFDRVREVANRDGRRARSSGRKLFKAGSQRRSRLASNNNNSLSAGRAVPAQLQPQAQAPPSPLLGHLLIADPSSGPIRDVTHTPSDEDEDEDEDEARQENVPEADGLLRNEDEDEDEEDDDEVVRDSNKPELVSHNRESFDWVAALSVGRNVRFLFHKPRRTITAQSLDAGSASPPANGGRRAGRSITIVSARQLAAVARRPSSSSEALLKELEPRGPGRLAAGTMGGAAHDRRRVNIEILDGFKVLATCWIIYGHTMMFFYGCLTDLRFGAERMFDLTMLATINTLQVVGLFYIITGCLLTYFSFSRARKKRQLLRPSFWLLVLLGRYLRLVPTYALVFWFARHLAPFTGAGRDWYDYRTDGEHPRGYCAREPWWVMWSMSAADVKIPMDCVPQAWYLSNDFRTLLVLPLYVFLLAKSAPLGYSAILATFLYSILKLVHILRLANIDYRLLLRWHPHVYALMADRLHAVYTDFPVRMSTYLLGVVVGHVLYLFERGHIGAWPRWLARFGLKLACFTASAIFFGVYLLVQPWLAGLLPARDQLSSGSVVWLIPLFKCSMELSLCAILLLLVTGAGYHWLKQLAGSQAMKILSNISYAVFLTHIEVMYKIPAAQYESNYWLLFLYATFCIFLSHLVAFFIYLLWEMPINNLTRHLFKRAYAWVSG